jgi:hypothetical protein
MDIPYTVAETSAPPYIPTSIGSLNAAKCLSEIQMKRVILNVGGKRFETSSATLATIPEGLLAEMVSEASTIKPYKNEEVPTYFVDRNPRFFDFILDYLRDPRNFKKILPTNKQILRQLHVEATYYRLTGLTEIIEANGQSSLWNEM